MAGIDIQGWVKMTKPGPRSALVILAGLLIAMIFGAAEIVPSSSDAATGEWAFWWLVGSLAALHRPLGGLTAGLGMIILPLVADRSGAGMAALLVTVAAATAELVRRRILAPSGWSQPTWTPWLVGLGQLATVLAASLLGAVAWRTSEGSIRFVLALAGYLLVAVASVEARRVGRPRSFSERASDWLPWGLDALGLSMGWGLSLLLPQVGGWRVGVLALVAACLIAEASRHAILREVSDQRIGDLVGLQQAHARILSERFDMGEIALQVYIECRNILPVDYFQFELFLPDGDHSWAADLSGQLVEGTPNPTAQPRALPGIHRRVNWRLIEEPLLAEGRPLARLRLWCDPRRIDPDGLGLLTSLLPQMATSVHRAWLDREAKIDPLTGVPVRRVLETRTQNAFKECHEEGRSMAVVMCDIDHFKRVNDTYGHEAGDHALILVAQTLDAQRREDDLCCRYGGEEFTLLLENTSGEQALRLAERLRSAVEELDFVYEGQPIPLTISAGVAAFPELHIKTAGELRLLADEALYAAKNGGRNRCVLHLGRGRFRGPDELPPEEIPRDFESPRIFG